MVKKMVNVYLYVNQLPISKDISSIWKI